MDLTTLPIYVVRALLYYRGVSGLEVTKTTKRELLNKLEKVWDTNLEVLAKQIMNANNPPKK